MAIYTLTNTTANDIWIDDILVPRRGTKAVDGLTPKMFALVSLNQLSITPGLPTDVDDHYVADGSTGTPSASYALTTTANDNFATLAKVVNNLMARVAWLEFKAKI